MSESFFKNLESATAEVWALMADIGRCTTVEPGITRAAWGSGEQLAAVMVADFARAKNLDVAFDRFGNIHIGRPGEDPHAPAVTIGSHLDSVPHGGNYDGLAGVAAGVAIVAAATAAGLRPPRPLRALALRCEESPWFGSAYLGSRLALGLASLDDVGRLIRADSGRSLHSHMAELGYGGQTSAPLAPLRPSNVACFLELHIEQGPLLGADGIPLGIATATRGNVRFPQARCRGEYGHSAAQPRQFRRDCVLAVAELALGLDTYWAQRIASGDGDFVATVGMFATDPAQHAMTKVAGEVTFSVNLGAAVAQTLTEAAKFLHDLVSRIERDRGVTFELGQPVGSLPMHMDDGLMRSLEEAAMGRGIATRRMPTVGHDTAMFVLAGIPAAMVLVRNSGGSHNPKEQLELEDFAAGVTVLADAVR